MNQPIKELPTKPPRPKKIKPPSLEKVKTILLEEMVNFMGRRSGLFSALGMGFMKKFVDQYAETITKRLSIDD